MKILFLIAFFLFINLNAQSSFNGVVSYQQTKKDFMGTHITFYDLYFNNKYSVYLYDEDKDEDLSGYKSTGIFVDLISETSAETPFYYRLLNGKEVIYNEPDYSKQYIVKDDAINFKWKIHPEKRNIGNYECTKATTEFRGRKYTAWFTNKIPVDYGPWKFHGLPGLILEIYDEEEVIAMYATAIQLNNAKTDINEILEEIDLNVEMTYHEFLENRCVDAKEFTKTLESKMPRGTGKFSNITVGSEENIEVDFQECTK